MSLGAVAISILPLGLFGTIFVVVLVVLVANALGKRRHAGRTLAAGVLAVGFLMLLLVAFMGLAWGILVPVVHHNRSANVTAMQAQAQVEHAQAMIEQARKQVEAQVAEVQARTLTGTTPGDRVMVEAPKTHVTQVIVPDVSAFEAGNHTSSSLGSNNQDAHGQDTHAQDTHGRETTGYADDGHGSSAPAAVTGERSSGLTVAGRPWTDAVEEFQDFQADVYPSLSAAAEALGRRAGQRLMASSDAGGTDPKSIYVWREGDEGIASRHATQDSDLVISRMILEAVASGIRQKLDSPAYVSVEQAPTEDRTRNILVKVVVQDFVFENHNRWRTHAESRSGAVALHVETADEPFSVSTRFVDAPWVEDRTGFVSAFPNGDWLVAYSDGTHSTHEGAREDALDAATNVLLPLAQARISQLPASDQHRFAQQIAKDPDWLRSRVADELVTRNLVTDRFAQRFDRSYGTVWREAVLVDAAPTHVQAIARSLVQGVDAKVTYQRNTWFSFIALAGLIFGTYLFLNMATKGYYAWMLRLAAVAGVGGVLFLIRFMA